MTQDEKIKFITEALEREDDQFSKHALELFKELIGNLIPEIPKEAWLVKLYPLESEFLAEVFLQDDECVDEYGPTPRQAILNAMEKIND